MSSRNIPIMTNKLLLLSLVTLITGKAFAQDDADTIGTIKIKRLDTLVFYNVVLSVTPGIGVARDTYYADDKEISRETYLKFLESNNNIEKCKPCWMRTYNKNEQLIYEGLQYGTAFAGELRGYYPGGGLKVSGYYKAIGNRYKKTGLWVYFNEDGSEKAKYVFD